RSARWQGSRVIELYTHGICNTRVVFFFQAEDGIRDRNVTGVQTCALPISFPRVSPLWMHTTNRYSVGICIHAAATAAATTTKTRSEERRVGKEWRTRWRPDPQKKRSRVPTRRPDTNTMVQRQTTSPRS